jgi:hypothetical protein
MFKRGALTFNEILVARMARHKVLARFVLLGILIPSSSFPFESKLFQIIHFSPLSFLGINLNDKYMYRCRSTIRCSMYNRHQADTIACNDNLILKVIHLYGRVKIKFYISFPKSEREERVIGRTAYR